MKFRDYVKEERIDEVAILAGLKDMYEYGKLVAKFGPKAAKKWRAIENALDDLVSMLEKEKAKQKFVKGKLKEGILTEERSDYSTDHLQDAIRHIRNGIEDMYELFDDIEDKKGMIQANRMKKEWKVLEKMAKPFVYNMDKIHQFRDELKNGGPITKPVVEPAEKPIEKQIEERLNEIGSEYDSSYLQTSIHDIKSSLEDIEEHFQLISNKKGLDQLKKFKKEWVKLEKLLKPSAYSLK